MRRLATVGLAAGLLVSSFGLGASADIEAVDRHVSYTASAGWNYSGQWAASVYVTEVEENDPYLPPPGPGSTLQFGSQVGDCSYNGPINEWDFKFSSDHAFVEFTPPADSGCGTVRVEWEATTNWVDCSWCRRNVNNDTLHQILNVRFREANAVIWINGVEQSQLVLGSASLDRTNAIEIWK